MQLCPLAAEESFSDPHAASLLWLWQVYMKTESFLQDSDLPPEDGTLLTYLLARAAALHWVPRRS
jgi:hypothetical protein